MSIDMKLDDSHTVLTSLKEHLESVFKEFKTARISELRFRIHDEWKQWCLTTSAEIIGLDESTIDDVFGYRSNQDLFNTTIGLTNGVCVFRTWTTFMTGRDRTIPISDPSSVKQLVQHFKFCIASSEYYSPGVDVPADSDGPWAEPESEEAYQEPPPSSEA